jgi:hypothetical protein
MQGTDEKRSAYKVDRFFYWHTKTMQTPVALRTDSSQTGTTPRPKHPSAPASFSFHPSRFPTSKNARREKPTISQGFSLTNNRRNKI